MVCGTVKSFHHLIQLKSVFLLNNLNLSKIILGHLAITKILANSAIEVPLMALKD